MDATTKTVGIDDIAEGQAFEFEGDRYVKIRPIDEPSYRANAIGPDGIPLWFDDAGRVTPIGH